MAVSAAHGCRPRTYGSALLAVLRIVEHLSNRPGARLQLAYLEVYNDTINDLLPRSDGAAKATGHDLLLREGSDGVFVEGLQHCAHRRPHAAPSPAVIRPAKKPPVAT